MCPDGIFPVVVSLCAVVLVEDSDGGIVPLKQDLRSPPDINNDAVKLQENGGVLAWGHFISSAVSWSDSTAFPLAIVRATSASSFTVVSALLYVSRAWFTVRASALVGSSSNDFVLSSLLRNLTDRNRMISSSRRRQPSSSAMYCALADVLPCVPTLLEVWNPAPLHTGI